MCVVHARRARAQPPKRVKLQTQEADLPSEDAAGAALRAWLTQWKHDDCGVYLSRLDGSFGCAPAGKNIRAERVRASCR